MATTPAVIRRHGPGAPGGSRDSRRSVAGVVATLRATCAAVAGGGVLACGVVLAVRRLSGGFDAAPPAVVWGVVAAGIGLVAGVDLASRRQGRGAAIAARCGLLLAAAAVALPPRPGDWTAPAAVVLAAIVAVLRPPSAPTMRPAGGRDRATVVSTVAARRPRRHPAPTRGGPAVSRNDPAPGKLLQRLERYESPPGTDCLRGRLTLSIASGGKATHAHVGFCPAFSEMPTVRVSTEYDGVEAVVAAAEVLPWGVRVECRLAEPADEPLEIPVDVFVQAPR